MSGLIWSGIGQGIAGAGQAFASSMFKDIEYQRQLEAEQRREEFALKRLEEAARINSEREEAKAEALKQRVARESADVAKTAAERGAKREAEYAGQDLSRLIAANPEMGSEEDYKKMLADPRKREAYEKAGLIEKRMDPRLQRADDEVQSALESGAHSSVIEAYSKKRTAVLDQIKQEFAEKKEENRYQEGCVEMIVLTLNWNRTLNIRTQWQRPLANGQTRPRHRQQRLRPMLRQTRLAPTQARPSAARNTAPLTTLLAANARCAHRSARPSARRRRPCRASSMSCWMHAKTGRPAGRLVPRHRVPQRLHLKERH